MEKIILKLGGSLITKKNAKDFPLELGRIRFSAENYMRLDVIKRVVDEIVSAKKEKDFSLILVNGAGPFGHFLVKKYIENKKLFDVKTIHYSVFILNEKLIEYFGDSLKLKSVAPFDTCYLTKTGFDVSNLWTEAEQVLNKSLIPSTYGDIVPTVGLAGRLGNYEVISGDDLVVGLAKLWKPDKIVMVTDVDGVYTKDPKTDKDAQLIKKIDEKMKIEYSNNIIDVSGGIGSKIRKLLLAKEFGVKSQIINGLVENNVRNVLLGDESIGTLIS